MKKCLANDVILIKPKYTWHQTVPFHWRISRTCKPHIPGFKNQTIQRTKNEAGSRFNPVLDQFFPFFTGFPSFDQTGSRFGSQFNRLNWSVHLVFKIVHKCDKASTFLLVLDTSYNRIITNFLACGVKANPVVTHGSSGYRIVWNSTHVNNNTA